MDRFNSKKILIVLIHDFAIWALCGAAIGKGKFLIPRLPLSNKIISL